MNNVLTVINRFVNSRSMVAVSGIVMLVVARFVFNYNEINYITTDGGMVMPSPNLWISSNWLSMVVNTALILATALFWMFIIQLFNPFRALTTLPATFYLLMMAAVPDLTDQFYGGTLIAALMPVCMALMWSSYGDFSKLRHVFLVFVLLSALCMAQYSVLYLLPVFVIGCAQMKIFDLRCCIAILLGIVTPWWIAWGFYPAAITSLSDFVHITSGNAENTFRSVFESNIEFFPATLILCFVVIAAWILNLMRILTLNVNLRAFNGMIAFMGIFTIIGIVVDYVNVAVYLPTLMLAASYQLSFLIHNHGR